MSEAPDKTDTFEAVVRRYEEVLQGEPENRWIGHTISLIDDLMRVCEPLGLLEKGNRTRAVEHWYTRAAAAITRCVVHPNVTIDAAQLDALCRRKQALAYIFQASGYRSMRHLQALMGEQTAQTTTIPNEKVAVLLSIISLDDLGQELITLALNQPPNILLPLMIGWLNQRAILTTRAEQNRGKLLASGHLVEGVEIDDSQIAPIVNAWMYSTYAESINKHSIKTSFNKLLSQRLVSAGITPCAPQPATSSKPKLLVIHERFREQHAMFRCYAPLISSLKPHFELIAMAEEIHIDTASDHIFDSFIKLGDGSKPINKLVEVISQLSPHMIYYPSLGMSHWTVMLAQLRLAPIQIMTHGHPATSMLPTIDYVYLNEADPTIATTVSEKILMGGPVPSFASHINLPETMPDLAVPTDREVRVAVNSKVMKLSHRLLTICRRLSDEATVPVKFSFFPGERGLYFDGISASIKAHLPEATVVPYVNYPTFLQEIAKCDLALAAFPFGNTNSTVDTCLLGLPTVAHFGHDSSSQTDALVIKTAGYPDWLVCNTDEAYFNTALELICDREKRLSVTKDLRHEEVRERLFSQNSQNNGVTAFAELFKYAFENHQNMRESSQRIFKSIDLSGGDH